MAAETLILLLTFVLALVHYLMPGFWKAQNNDMAELVGARDNMKPIENPIGQRALRATNNFKETVPWAIGLLILVQVTDDANGATALGGWLYLISRIAYIPAYLSGIPYIRSIAWAASLLGLVVIALQLL